MNEDRVLIAKSLLGFVGTFVGLVCIRFRIGYGLLWPDFRRLALLFLTATRATAFVLLFLIAGFSAQSDVVSYYYPQAKFAASGLLPYRDFPSSYGPLFSYISALPVMLWDSPAAIIALSILFEIASAFLWTTIMHEAADDETARRAVWLYLTSAFAFWNVVIVGQNQVWVSAFLALSILLARRHRPASSGIILALSVISVKFLSGFFGPGVARFSGKPILWGLVFLSVLIVAVSLGSSLNMDLFYPIKFEGMNITSGNVWFLCTAIGLDFSRPHVHQICTAVTGIGLLLVYGFLLAKKKFDKIPDMLYSFCALLLFFLLTSKKSYTNYLVMIFFPLCLAQSATMRQKGGGLFRPLLFGAVMTICLCEPSFWFRLGSTHKWEMLANPGVMESPSFLYIFIGVELLLLGSYIWLLMELYRLLFPPKGVQSI